MPDSSARNARLAAGPFDGAILSLDIDPDDLLRAIVVAFAVGDDASRLVWHTYVLDRSRSVFRYLGDDRIESDDESAVGSGPAGSGNDPVSADALSRRFYELLFQRHPSLRHMFPDDIGHQAAMLQTALRAALHHLDNPEWLVSALGSLGAQHAEWGVTESMYRAFTECMLTVMAEEAGAGWSPETESEWRGTLGNITTLMLRGTSPAG